jgi:hypothetical protein
VTARRSWRTSIPDSPTYLQILKSLSTAIPACDIPTAHYCGRADELGDDPVDHLMLIANDAPLSPTKLCPILTNPTAHCAVDPYATFSRRIHRYCSPWHTVTRHFV